MLHAFQLSQTSHYTLYLAKLLVFVHGLPFPLQALGISQDLKNQLNSINSEREPNFEKNLFGQYRQNMGITEVIASFWQHCVRFSWTRNQAQIYCSVVEMIATTFLYLCNCISRSIAVLLFFKFER